MVGIGRACQRNRIPPSLPIRERKEAPSVRIQKQQIFASLSVQQHKRLQPLRDVSSVRQAVFNDGSGRQTLQRSVIDGLNQVLGHLLLIQQVTRSLFERIGAVEMRPAGDQQVHDVRMVVGGSYVKGAVVIFVAAVHVSATLQQDGRYLERGKLADRIAAHARCVPVNGQVQGAVAVLPAGLKLEKLVNGLLLEVILLDGTWDFLQQADEVQDD